MPLDPAVAILDPDDVLAELKLDDSEYARIERIVNAASARLERAANTVFRTRAVTKTFDGDGTPVLDLPGPAIAVHWVTVDGKVQDAAAYVVDTDLGRVIATGGWPLGLRNIQVNATLGYDPVPHEVREACLLLVRRMASPSSDLHSEHIGDYGYTKFEPSGEGDLPDDVEALVLPFRRWRF